LSEIEPFLGGLVLEWIVLAKYTLKFTLPLTRLR
jgi:hypothetical protein